MNQSKIFNFENNLFQLEVKTENGYSLFDVEAVARSWSGCNSESKKEGEENAVTRYSI